MLLPLLPQVLEARVAALQGAIAALKAKREKRESEGLARRRCQATSKALAAVSHPVCPDMYGWAGFKGEVFMASLRAQGEGGGVIKGMLVEKGVKFF